MSKGKVGNEYRMFGTAAEYRVISEVLLRGHSPYKPACDIGTDLIIENGLRIQIKAARLRYYNKRTQAGKKCYSFSLRQQGPENWNNGRRISRMRDWSLSCDFFVFWCFEEDRFFVVPESFLRGKGDVWIMRREDEFHHPADEGLAKKMFQDGMKIGDIAKHFGVCHLTAKSAIFGLRPNRRSALTSRIREYENRWDLLDVDTSIEKVAEATEKEILDNASKKA